MALDKGLRGIGHEVWLASRTVRLARKTWSSAGSLSRSYGIPLGDSVLIFGTRARPHPGRDKRHPLLLGSRQCDASCSVLARGNPTTDISYLPTTRVVMVG